MVVSQHSDKKLLAPSGLKLMDQPKHPDSSVSDARQFVKNVFCRKCCKFKILTHLAYIANGKKPCYIVQQFHWANKRDVTLRHL